MGGLMGRQSERPRPVDGRERVCGSCARFRFSGLAWQMSGGRKGYCGLVGFRVRAAIVGVDHGCDEWAARDGGGSVGVQSGAGPDDSGLGGRDDADGG